MPDRQNHRLFAIEAIQNDVGSVTKLDNPLAKLRRRLIDRSSDGGMLPKDFDPLADCVNGPHGGFRVFVSEKVIEADNVVSCG
jgi:hypothetical protein